MDSEHPRLITSCPLCQTAYTSGLIRFCGDQGAAKIYHCTCSSCRHAMIAVVTENSGWASSIGMVTDLAAEDVKRLEGFKTVSVDDCIRLHEAFDRDSRKFCRSLLEKKVA